MKGSRRALEIEPFQVMDVLARARAMEAAGSDVIHMEIGEPDFDTPAPIIEAGVAALQQGLTHYTPALGLPQLRTAISQYYQSHFAVNISCDRIVVTPGSSGALQLALAALVNPGDEVLIADPGYPCNRHFVRLFEGRPALIAVDESTQYQLTADLIDRHWTGKTKAVLLASPSNPTGTCCSLSELERIVELVQRRGGVLIVDEIYQSLVYDTKPETVLSISDDLIVINSFSKYFGMTGWRVGWMVVPESYVPVIDKLAQNFFLATSTPAQYAALAAFNDETLCELEKRRQQLKQRRDYLVKAVKELGFEVPVIPQGAFYIYARCSALSDDSRVLVDELLENTAVALTPGSDFGHHNPGRHVRFAYTTKLSRLREGVARIKAYLERSHSAWQ